jgi:hypothetical protein
MGDPRLDAPACLVLAADMIIPRRAAGLAYLRMTAKALVFSLLDLTGSNSPTVDGELIITRRDTGAELLRTETGFPLAHVRGQLDELTVAEFLTRWGIDPGRL